MGVCVWVTIASLVHELRSVVSSELCSAQLFVAPRACWCATTSKVFSGSPLLRSSTSVAESAPALSSRMRITSPRSFSSTISCDRARVTCSTVYASSCAVRGRQLVHREASERGDTESAEEEEEGEAVEAGENDGGSLFVLCVRRFTVGAQLGFGGCAPRPGCASSPVPCVRTIAATSVVAP